jgi:hypothetical protein
MLPTAKLRKPDEGILSGIPDCSCALTYMGSKNYLSEKSN